MLAIAACPSFELQKALVAVLRLIIVGLPSGVRGLAKYFATAVPNYENGGFAPFFLRADRLALVSIAKHWGFSL
jgi:hypothetical protein